MKAKLLKKLRKRFAKQYPIKKIDKCYCVDIKEVGGYTCKYAKLEDAQDRVLKEIRNEMIECVAEFRKCNPRKYKTFTFYPW